MFSKFKKNTSEKKRSIFKRLARVARDDEEESSEPISRDFTVNVQDFSQPSFDENGEETGEGQLAVDIYQTDTNIYIQAIPAGVSAEDLNISITPDTVVITGKREGPQVVAAENYLVRELYWGTFSRTIVLPEEIEPSEADAIEKHGLLIIRLPKIDKMKKHKLKVKSI
jgi:HSP20 family protein